MMYLTLLLLEVIKMSMEVVEETSMEEVEGMSMVGVVQNMVVWDYQVPAQSQSLRFQHLRHQEPCLRNQSQL